MAVRERGVKQSYKLKFRPRLLLRSKTLEVLAHQHDGEQFLVVAKVSFLTLPNNTTKKY